MADILEDDRDEELFEDDAAVRIGRKIMEMADRVTDVARALPGSQATWNFEVDDRRYKVVVALVESPAP